MNTKMNIKMNKLTLTLTTILLTFSMLLSGCGSLQSREVEEIALILAGSSLMRQILPDETPVAITCTTGVDATELSAMAGCVIEYADGGTYDLLCTTQPEIECAAIKRP